MPKVKVGDIQIHYQEAGGGDPLLLIMGWGGDHTAWALQIPAFSAEFRCVAFDNRGAGQSDQPDVPYSIRMMAGDTITLMDALGIERAHVSGLSMGGMIAQEIAINHPGRVLSLQLHATTARPDPYLIAVGRSLLSARAGLSRQEFVGTLLPWVLTPHAYAERPELVELLAQRLVENPYPASLTGLRRQAEACWAHDTEERLPRIQCPTLITVGAEDIFVPLRFSRLLQERIPGAELIVIEGGGHGCLWEQAEVFNEICLGFLRKHRHT
jgi:pimeloyl-ACP methyl ester carboxylesterase